MKDGAYVVNIDEYYSTGTHWIALYWNGNNVTYFDNFGAENFPKEIKTFIGSENIITNIKNAGLWLNTFALDLLISYSKAKVLQTL